MNVFQEGQVNLANLTVADVYVIVRRPSVTRVNGVDTGIVGSVGGASWGPINIPLDASTPAELTEKFGPLSTAPNDMPSDLLINMQLGVLRTVGVRVSDGTDTKAIGNLTTPGVKASKTVTIGGTVHVGDVVTVTVGGNAVSYTVVAADDSLGKIAAKVAAALNANITFALNYTAVAAGAIITVTAKAAGAAGNAVTLVAAVTGAGATVTATAGAATLSGGVDGDVILPLEALYSGTEGNKISVLARPGANSTAGAPTWTLVVTRSGFTPETFPNLPEATLAASFKAALENGLNAQRGPSRLVRGGAIGAGTGAPSEAEFKLSNGTNGDQFITSSHQLGSNVTYVPTGMYALAGRGVQQFVLAGNTDVNTWALMADFGTKAGALGISAFPAGTDTATAVAAKRASGVDSPYLKLVKDWVYFNDTYNAVLRFVAPTAFALGRLASLSPEQSPMNKPIALITNTERTVNEAVYSYGEFAALEEAGIDVITNQCPGGSFFGLRNGLNTSTNSETKGDEYTRMTNFLAYSFLKSFGGFVGRNQSEHPSDPLRDEAKKALQTFLSPLKNGETRMLDNFSVNMDFGPGLINTPQGVRDGLMYAEVQAKYLSVVRKFLISMTGGKSVEVAVS